MAAAWGDLEPLLASREDLFDLALKLGAAGVKASPAQLLEAHDVLLGLRLAGTLPANRLDWVGYLAPIFCRSAADQQTFHRIFPEWARQQPELPTFLQPVSIPAPAKDTGAHAIPTKPNARRKQIISLAALLAVFAAALLLSGLFKQRSAPDQVQPHEVNQTTGEVSPQPKPTPLPAKQTAFPPRPLERNIPPTLPIGPYDFTADQLPYLAAGMPFAIFGLWFVIGYFNRRTVLTKESGQTPAKPHTYWVHGADTQLFHPSDFAFAGARFREPVSHPTRRIHAGTTLAATVRKAGLFTPMYRRRRRHPEHLVLIDRASHPSPSAHPAAPDAARDHLAAYGQALIEQFQAEQVIAHVYHFDRDPRRCHALDSGISIDLAALESRHGDCRLLVLSDAVGLFEPLSGRPVGWLDAFDRWPLRVVLTPKRVEEWGYPEGTLALNGFAVAPIHPRSLAMLAEIWLPLALRDDVTDDQLQQVRLLAPLESRASTLPETFSRHGDRWLERVPPAGESALSAVNALGKYLGTDGLALLQALAVYPEHTWPLTLYMDWQLYAESDPAERGARLVSLARLPWLRHGRMPNYLRLALIRQMPRKHHRKVVGLYQQLLKAVDEQGPHAIALNVEPPPEVRVLERLMFWKPKPTYPVRDRIFAKMLLGGSPPGRLEMEITEAFARLLPGTGWNEVVVRLFIGLFAALGLSLAVALVLRGFGDEFGGWIKSRQDARHGVTEVRIIHAPTTDWQEGPLVDALTGGGFAPRVEDPFIRDGVPLRPAPVLRKQNVILAGKQAQAAGRWVQHRLRYLNYGSEVQLNPPSNTEETALAQTVVADNEVIVWLADVPQIFQDKLIVCDDKIISKSKYRVWHAGPSSEQRGELTINEVNRCPEGSCFSGTITFPAYSAVPDTIHGNWKNSEIYFERDVLQLKRKQVWKGSCLPGSMTGTWQFVDIPDDHGPFTIDYPGATEISYIEPNMVEIPAGQFTMGSPANEKDRYKDEGPQHTVKIGKFALGVNEVTFDEYDAFAEATGREKPDDRGNRPVINVSWDDAQAYAAWLSEKTGKHYRLPTEAEWEYAARGKTQSPYWWGQDVKQGGKAWANCNGCGSEWDNKQTAPVGSFQANAFGLHDTAGNVWEWVQDCYHESYKGAPSDGSVWEDKKGCDSSQRVLRGGSCFNYPFRVRSAGRGGTDPDDRNSLIGFRLARTL